MKKSGNLFMMDKRKFVEKWFSVPMCIHKLKFIFKKSMREFY